MTKTIVIGHIGADATVNTVNGKQVINFNLAHSETWKDSHGEQQSKTTWFQVSKWGEKVGIAPYLTKGTLVYVEGKVEAKAYQTKDGSTGASIVLTATDIQLLGGKKEGQQQSAPAQQQPITELPYDDQSDLPF